jgi:hypothetical protein
VRSGLSLIMLDASDVICFSPQHVAHKCNIGKVLQNENARQNSGKTCCGVVIFALHIRD